MAREKFIGHNLNDDEANKKLNLAAAMYGFADPAFGSQKKDDPSDGYTSEMFGDGWEQMPAPSTGRRRRAKWIGYHRGMQMLLVVFTYEPRKKSNPKSQVRAGDIEPWVRYEDVDLEMWEELKNYHSTGEWLKFSGVEDRNYYRTRPGEIDEITQEYLEGLKLPN
jgi:hypothetical protein